jgi:hypothetical protein
MVPLILRLLLLLFSLKASLQLLLMLLLLPPNALLAISVAAVLLLHPFTESSDVFSLQLLFVLSILLQRVFLLERRVGLWMLLAADTVEAVGLDGNF